ncbi:MAG: NAD(P)/FAD-dependent oxidoreductase, partial [Candidatus Rokuibacteriota bacterium]
PGVLALVALQALAGRRLPDLVTPLVTALYSAERLAEVGAPAPAEYDVVVIGGGPGGASVATHLARAGLSVAVFEREVFPRAHVGESLMPATMLLLERLGARECVEASGFQIKYGASFHESDTGHAHTFYFLQNMPWPGYAYQVPRAEFDTILLDNARKQGVTVFQPEAVEGAEFDRDGVTVTVASGDAARRVRARFLVDATGRASFMATRAGRRARVPNLGKVALWAHWKGAPRLSGREEGNIRIYLGEDGWFWWIPLAQDLTSIGAVCHAKTVAAFGGTPEALYDEMIRRSAPVADGLAAATRVTEVHREANFAYFNQPVRGDRFLAVGDAIAFVDPIFSGGVFIALWSGEVAAEAIVRAFRAGRFGARRFRAYERRVRTRMAPLFKFIHKYYEPAFMEIFVRPRNILGVVDGVLSVLSGGSFLRMTWRARFALAFLFTIARINVWKRRRAGLPVESRLEW